MAEPVAPKFLTKFAIECRDGVVENAFTIEGAERRIKELLQMGFIAERVTEVEFDDDDNIVESYVIDWTAKIRKS